MVAATYNGRCNNAAVVRRVHAPWVEAAPARRIEKVWGLSRQRRKVMFLAPDARKGRHQSPRVRDGWAWLYTSAVGPNSTSFPAYITPTTSLTSAITAMS